MEWRRARTLLWTLMLLEIFLDAHSSGTFPLIIHASVKWGERCKEDALTEGQGSGAVVIVLYNSHPTCFWCTSWGRSQQAAPLRRLPVLRYPLPTWHNLAVHIPQEKLSVLLPHFHAQQSCTHLSEYFLQCDNIKATCNQLQLLPETAHCLQNQ